MWSFGGRKMGISGLRLVQYEGHNCRSLAVQLHERLIRQSHSLITFAYFVV
jgi:hypothetical protein